jgi:hypothetical protein
MRNLLALLFILLCNHNVVAQEKLGITNSNYHPVSSIHLNASSSVDSRTYMQLNLVGANVFVMTNAAYLPNFGYINFARTQQVSDPQPKDGRLKKFANFNAVLDGPAFTFTKKNIAFGFFLRARSVADVRRIPYQVTDLLFNGDVVNQTESGIINAKNARFSNMTWAEYGANFGGIVRKRRTDMISLAGNVKYLTGINLQYLNISNLQAQYSSNGLFVENLAGTYKSSNLAWNSGRGFGIDLGGTYKRMLSHVDGYKSHSKSSKCRYIDYKFKVGVSLRDFCYITFNDNTSQSEVSGNNIFISNQTVNSREDLETSFTTNVVEGAAVRAFLPAALSGQLDYNFENNVYLNFTINKNLLLNRMTGVQSPNFISVAPRFETRIVEVAMPLTFQQFLHPQLGFAFRFRSFVLGFDNVVPLALRRNTSGIGVYFNLAISLFRNPACGSTRNIDDCGGFKFKKPKIKRKNTMISPNPRRV